MVGSPRGFVAQFEIQLGHLCNNRCVFCVSGALTHAGSAPLLDAADLLAQLRSARAAGHDRVTLLGGEPTIQPYFLDVVREAVALGFEEIVIFSNGSKPGRTSLVDQVLATGGRFEWRFSFQGATREAHERTTRRRGSWTQLVRSLERVRARGQKATVNMCIVRQNFESLPEFPALLVPRGVAQLHVDMLNPYDVGTLPDHEVRELQPRYRALAEPLARMIQAFPPGFDVNVGNLPYCVAPGLAPWIHHGGQPTWTVTADDFGRRELQRERTKYLVKADRRRKLEGCASCVYDDRCSGVFDAYLRWFGPDEFVPVTTERLAAIDPQRAQLALHLRPVLRRALASLPAPFTRASVVESELSAVTLELDTGVDGGDRLVVVLRAAGDVDARALWLAVERAEGDRARLSAALRALQRSIEEAGDLAVTSAGDAALGFARPRVAAAMARLAGAAPHGALRWRDVRVEADGRRAECELASPAGERAFVWVDEAARGLRAGYRVERDDDRTAPSEALVTGLQSALRALGRLPALPRAS